MSSPVVEATETRVTVSWPDLGVGFVFDRFREHSGDTYAEIATHYWTTEGPNGLLGQVKANLLGTRTPKDLASRLAERDRTQDWVNLVEIACTAALRAHRVGAPFETAGGDEAIPPAVYRIAEVLPDGKPTQWYGTGGSGKSMLAVLAGVCIQNSEPWLGRTVRPGLVLYLDWEDDRATLTRRIQTVAAGLHLPPPRFQYRQCTRRLADEVEPIAAWIRRVGISLVIIDSVTGAGGPVSEQGGYELVAQHLMAAVRCLPCTVLLIDHVSDMGRTGKQLAGKSYGSIRKRDLCRSAWEVRADREPGSKQLHVGLFHTKANHSELFAPIGVEIDFGDPATTRFRPRDVRASAELASNVGAVSRMYYELKGGPLALLDLAARLDMKPDSVYRTARRHPETFVEVTPGQRGGAPGLGPAQ